MWEPESRGFIVIASALSLCLLLYKIWGPVLILSISLVLVISTCYSLLVDDSIISPQILVIFDYIKNYIIEVFYTLKHFFLIGSEYFFEFVEYLKFRYSGQEERNYLDSMNGRRGNIYRLSSDFSDQPSPIIKSQYSILPLNGNTDGVVHTSTPLNQTAWKKDIHQNGGIGIFTSTPIGTSKKVSSNRCENKIPLPSSNNDIYSTKNSQWSNHTSSKIRNNINDNKPIQTIAGPLLTSNKYNINPKVYTDVNSPGLTTRLTKYACEANNRLTHQPQYGVGQFPKVNLNASPIPLISPKSIRNRAPVTVRIAPPENIPYSDSNLLMDQRKSFLGTHCELKQDLKPANVNQVLKEISLKRHASKEDVMIDLIKKQRTEKIPEVDLDNLEEMMQKRARDESLTSDEDVSPQTKTQRPLKRPKASSCHDILNSLSSSINIASGVKRKIMDTSRCNSPDIEKHFKSSKSPPKNTSLTFINLENARSKQELNVDLSKPDTSKEPSIQETVEKNSEITNQPLKKLNLIERLNDESGKVNKEVQVGPEAVKLTDKLFMRAEPQNNEKLKTLIRELGIIEAKFTTDDKELIKKQDIDYMRQNSMRSRLQSMFDAISGKTAKSIDPNLVIQAENINSGNSSTYTTLNSSTMTTSINTSPITTSSIIPILKSDNDFKSSNSKHVTFNLPNPATSISTFSSTSIVQTSSNQTDKTISVSTTANCKELTTNSVNSKIVTQKPSLEVSIAPANSTTVTSNLIATSSCLPAIHPNLSKDPISTENIPNTTANTTTYPQSNIKSDFNAVPLACGPTKTNSSSMFTFGNKITTSTSDSTSNSKNSNMTFGFNNSLDKTTSISKNSTSSNSILPLHSTVNNTAAVITTAANLNKMPELSSSSTIMLTQKNILPKTSNSTISSFGNSVTTSPVITTIQNSTNTLFAFGNTSHNKQDNFSSGVPANSQGSTLFNATSLAMNFSSGSCTSSNLQNLVTKSAVSTPLTTANTSATPNFSFGATSQEKVNFSFSNPSNTVSEKTSNSSIFGGSSSIILPNSNALTNVSTPTTTTSSLFGTSSSGFGSSTLGFNPVPSTTNNVFSSTTTTSSSIFGNSNNSSIFGMASSIPVTTAGLFSTTQSVTSPISTHSSFTNTNLVTFSDTNKNIGVPAAPAIFGSTTSTLFTGTNTNLNTTTAHSVANSLNFSESSNIFGQQKSFGNTNTSFGNNNPSLNFASPTTTANNSIFNNSASGSSGLPSFNTIKPVAQFGAPSTTVSENKQNTTSIFGSPSMNNFSNNNESKTPFGNSKTSSTSIFGAAVSTQAQSFGTTTNTFGTQNQASTFGTNVNASNSSPFASQTSTLFGGSKPLSNTSSSTFTFGTSQAQQPQTQATSSFSFSGTSTNQNSSSDMFQFGTNTNQQKTEGFNFNAPTGAPTINFSGSSNPTIFNAPTPGFNAPAANMFNIGAGSSTSRSRTSRQRRQR